MEPAAAVAFALAAVLHAGFQATVTVLVYPALVRLGLERPEDWLPAHARHSRAIVPLVGVVYVALLAAGVALLVAGPGALDLVALGGAWGAVLVTGTVAAPTHGRLDRPDPALLRRLVTADRARCVLALVGAAGAVASVVTHVQG